MSPSTRSATQAIVTVRLDEAAEPVARLGVRQRPRRRRDHDDEDATGLRGLEERVRAARGTFAVSSPATGPTIVTAVLPCAS